MKVLVVVSKYPPEYAGPGYIIHNMFKRLSEKKTDLTWKVICNSSEFRGGKNYIYDDIHVTRVSPKLFFLWRKYPGIFKKVGYLLRSYIEAFITLCLLWKEKPDLVHTLGGGASVSVAIAWTRYKNIPLVIELVTAGATPYQPLPLINTLHIPDLRYNTLIIAISDYLGGVCKNLGLELNTWVRPNPVDTNMFVPCVKDKYLCREKLTPFAKEDCVLLSVAKFMPLKNQVFLLDVLEKLPEKFKLILAGPVVTDGEYFQRDTQYLQNIRNKAESAILRNRVVIIDKFVNAFDYMKISDVYLMPALNEGLGTPLLESMAAGVPVVANRDVASFQEWIKSGDNGFLCELNPDHWAGAIKKLENLDSERRKEISGAVKKYISMEELDSRYYTLTKKLLTLPNNKIFDVESI